MFVRLAVVVALEVVWGVSQSISSSTFVAVLAGLGTSVVVVFVLIRVLVDDRLGGRHLGSIWDIFFKPALF